jgi:HSP20 family protein
MARATDAEKRQSSQSEAGAATTGEGGRSTATAEGGQQTVPVQQGGGQLARRGRQTTDLARPRSFRRMFDELDRLFEDLQRQVFGQDLLPWGSGDGWLPRMEVQDTGSEVVLTVELPGFEPDEISVECTDDLLTISGEHHETEQRGDVRAARTFFRQIAVPAGCDVDKTRASYRNGVLTIRLPRAQESVRRIPISSEASGGRGQQQGSGSEEQQRAGQDQQRAA